MLIEKLDLFSSKRDVVYFLLLCLTLLSFSLGYKYYQYTQLTKFDSQIINAEVLKHYSKTKRTKTGRLSTKYIAKLRADDGSVFYTITSKKYPHLLHKHLQLEIWAGNISFLEYLKGYFAFSKILHVSTQSSLKEQLYHAINNQHASQKLQELFNALFLAQPPSKELQKQLSELGVSHLIALSGFHLGILSGVLFFLFKLPYRYLQQRYFPYRFYTKDSFFVIALLLFGYLLFLDIPDSLLRAYGMFVIGYILYDRWFVVLSMQTLFVSVLLLVALVPKLFFSLGFYLSVGGVFYIFLFTSYTKNLSKLWQFILLPFWVYLMMLPYSIALFHNFSTLHPLSVLWTTLFSVFYPLELFLHLISHGNLLDEALEKLLHVSLNNPMVFLPKSLLILHILLSIVSAFKYKFLPYLLAYSLFLFIYFIYNVT